jgi:hypothetical protein
MPPLKREIESACCDLDSAAASLVICKQQIIQVFDRSPIRFKQTYEIEAIHFGFDAS